VTYPHKLLKGQELKKFCDTLDREKIDFTDLGVIAPPKNVNSHFLNASILPNGEGNIKFIPLTVRGRFRDHLVVFLVDIKKKKIMFSDPRGATIADHPYLKDALQVITKNYFRRGDEVTLEENRTRWQRDGFNCAIYGFFLAETASSNPGLGLEDLLRVWNLESATRSIYRKASFYRRETYPTLVAPTEDLEVSDVKPLLKNHDSDSGLEFL
jgi:hypothetical protein